MFTAKQMARLNHYAHNIHLRNCSIYPNDTTVERIEQLSGGRLLATINSVDAVKGIFHTSAVVTIGPRGGINYESKRKEVF